MQNTDAALAPIHTEILVVGGGPAGLSLAAALGHAGIGTICIDRAPVEDHLATAHDGRTTAIALGSKRLFEGIGAWQPLAETASPIREIRTADQHSPLFLHFDARDAGEQAFGWIVENRVMRRVLLDRIALLDSVEHWAPATLDELELTSSGVIATLEDGRRIQASLLCGADGRHSPVRQWAGIETTGWRYQQKAIVCVVTHDKPHGQVALEHFLPGGPFAVLPMNDDAEGRHRSSIVWTEKAEKADAYAALDQANFDHELTRRFGGYLGAVRQTGRRWVYPLELKHAHRYTAPRTALIGEAAHVIHPIAGQGLNMGFRDVAALVECLADQRRLGLDPGAPEVLRRFQRMRMRDNILLSAVTDVLDRLFSNDIGPIRRVRQLGLGAVDRLPPLKRFFMQRAMGVGPDQPRLVRGERL